MNETEALQEDLRVINDRVEINLVDITVNKNQTLSLTNKVDFLSDKSKAFEIEFDELKTYIEDLGFNDFVTGKSIG